MVNEERTEEQKREGYRKNALDNLADAYFQEFVGFNEIRERQKTGFYFGQAGSEIVENMYPSVMNGEGANKAKQRIYEERLEKRGQLGIAEELPFPTNYDLSEKIISDIQSSFAVLNLGDIESIVKKIDNNLKFSVPNELRGISQMSLIPKLTNGENLTPKEQYAMNFMKLYAESYNENLAWKIIDGNRSNRFNEVGAKLVEEYSNAA